MNQKGRTKDMGENIVWNSKIARLILIHLNKKEIDYASNTAREIKFWTGGVINKFKELREEGLIEPTEKKERRSRFAVTCSHKCSRIYTRIRKRAGEYYIDKIRTLKRKIKKKAK